MSTRSGTGEVTFQEALFAGLAPDGGLFVPTWIPTLESIERQTATSFPILSTRVLSKWFVGDIPDAELECLLKDALSFSVPLVRLHGDGWEDVHILELFHGPTLSFKDFGARTMARLMQHYLSGRGDKLTILVATSGDTGSAVADGFAGLNQIQVVLLYPEGQVSAVQERQLTAARPGVAAFAVDGTFDDCQQLVKAAFVDPDLSHLNLTSANSINVGRLLPQMLFHIWGVSRAGYDQVSVCVPSGNLGNLTSGVMAGLAGLPVRQFLAAHNANDYFPRLLAGERSMPGASIRTYSNAMDVGNPSNLERIEALLGVARMSDWIQADSVDDASTLSSMRRVYESTGYLADPHTSVGLEVVRRLRDSGVHEPTIVLATAHPAKFPDVVQSALGFEPEEPDRLASSEDLPTQEIQLIADREQFKKALLQLGR